MVRKKTLRLLLCDYQRTVRYYTIYRTFKQWPSDDFTTIYREKLRLLVTTIPEAVTTIPAGTLRLLLTSISYRAKARKEMRRKPPMVPRSCCWTAPPGTALASDPHTAGVDPAAAGMVCPLIYLIIIGGCADLCSVPAWRWYLVSVEGVRARVCAPAWHRRYYSRFCRSGIVGG